MFFLDTYNMANYKNLMCKKMSVHSFGSFFASGFHEADGAQFF